MPSAVRSATIAGLKAAIFFVEALPLFCSKATNSLPQ
jgi:hypothetical protein